MKLMFFSKFMQMAAMLPVIKILEAQEEELFLISLSMQALISKLSLTQTKQQFMVEH